MLPPDAWLFIAALGLTVFFIALPFLRNTLSRKQFDSLPSATMVNGGQKVLVLIPHPDDESLAVGGYIYMCRKNKAAVRLILVSDGNRRGRRDQRYLEFRSASRALGIPECDLLFWEFPDGSLQLNHKAVEAQLIKEIGLYRPDFIIYPHPDDKHRDHSTLGKSTERSLIRSDRLDVHAYAYLIHYNFYQLPSLFSNHLLPPRSTPDNRGDWHKIVLSPEAYRAKHLALLKYRSQRRNPLLLPLFLVSLRDNELLCQRKTALQS